VEFGTERIRNKSGVATIFQVYCKSKNGEEIDFEILQQYAKEAGIEIEFMKSIP
jgi:glutathionylspermidine synthase